MRKFLIAVGMIGIVYGIVFATGWILYGRKPREIRRPVKMSEIYRDINKWLDSELKSMEETNWETEIIEDRRGWKYSDTFILECEKYERGESNTYLEELDRK